MSGTLGKRFTLAALAFLMVITGLAPGGTGVAIAATIDATWIQTVNPATWAPPSPGPSGIAYRADNNSLIVVDTEVSETNNIWEFDLDTNTVTYTAALEIPGDATGIALDPGPTSGAGDDTIYVSSDGDQGIYIFEADGNGRYGGSEDGVILTDSLVNPTMDPLAVVDTEDPAFDPTTGHLFFLNGGTGTVFELDPMAGGFGDADDVLVTPGGWAVPGDGVIDVPTDWEGMALDTATGHLLVGSKEISNPFHVIHEATKTGTLVNIIDLSDAEIAPPNGGGLWEVNGLGVQPAGDDPKTYWIADRGLSTDLDVFDGRVHRVFPGALPPEPPVAPTLTPIPEPVVGNELGVISFDANATDTNFGDVLTYSIQPAAGNFPTGATINANSGVFSWTPTEAQGPGTYEVKVRVTDNDADGVMSSFQDVTVNVAEVNQNPVIIPNPDILRAEGEQVGLAMTATDGDLPAQTITWLASGLPAGLSINSTSGLISGTLAGGTTAGSPYNVTVTARDSLNGTGTDTFQFAVTNTNKSPILGNITNKTVAQGFQLAFKATATDPDGDALTFSLVNGPAGAAITSAGNFTWTPNVAPGNYPVTVRVTDNGSPVLTDQQTLTVTVQAAGVDPFIDDDGHIFENAIEWLAGEGITQGCNPPVNNRFCPDDFVTRGQMAAFLVRAFGYTAIADDFFIDDSGSVFENAINRLRTAEVTRGCNPPVNNRYCPDDLVTRGQMAAFLVRAFGYTDSGTGNYFVDDNGSVFENAIDKLRTAGVTQGCNPPVNNRYCPDAFVTRGQMAAFLKRALGG